MELQSLADTRAQIQAAYGPRAIRRANMLEAVTVIPTGIFIMDLALLGGCAESTGNMFYGWESSGKTSNLYRAAGQYQKKYPDKIVAWIDLDPMGFQQEWAIALGCDPKRVEITQVESGEAAVDCADVLAKTREIGLIIVDGISGFVSAKQIDEAAGDVQIAPIAKNAGKFCSKMRVAMMERGKDNNKLTVLSSNQWRFKITMMGDPRILPGGTQANFFHQVKMELASTQIDTENKKAGAKHDAIDTTFTATKTKNPSGIRQGSYRVITSPQHPLGYGTVDEASTILNYALQMGVLEGKAPKLNAPLYGATFTTREAVEERLQKDPAFNLYMRQDTISRWRVHKGHTAFPKDNWLAGSKNIIPGNVVSIAVGGISKPAAPAAAPKPAGAMIARPAIKLPIPAKKQA